MKPRITAISALVLSTALAAGIAGPKRADAQTYDHLKCFKVKDPGAFGSATMDLDDLLFGPTTGCVIKKKAKELCIPVDKTVTEVVGGSETPLAGQGQVFDRLCYKLKCPVSPTGTQGFVDQFGTRGFEKFKIAQVCTPTVKGDAPVSFPADPDSYVTGPVAYIDSLTIPDIGPNGPECCRDFGTISKDYIEGGTSHYDNSLAVLSSAVGSLFDLQQTLTDSITGGSLVVLLDHQGVNAATLPDHFKLAQLSGTFDAGTTPLDAAAGNGQFLVTRDSFAPASGEPENFAFPALMDSTSVAAGPFDFGLVLPLPGAPVEVPISQTELRGDHGAITSAGIAYTNGTLSGYIDQGDVYGAMNTLLASPQCACLGLSGDVFTQLPDGSWTATCVFNASGLCTLPEEQLCVTLAGDNPFGGSPPQICTLIGGILTGAADLDLDGNTATYEGLSIGLAFTTQNAQVNGVEP